MSDRAREIAFNKCEEIIAGAYDPMPPTWELAQEIAVSTAVEYAAEKSAALQAENERLLALRVEDGHALLRRQAEASNERIRAERAESDLAALTAENAGLRAEVTKWQRIRTPTHGPCCTCQKCGQHYDDCRCDLDEVVDELELTKADLAALTAKMEREELKHEPGTPMARLSYLLDELVKRFPSATSPFSSEPPEPRLLAAMDARIADLERALAAADETIAGLVVAVRLREAQISVLGGVLGEETEAAFQKVLSEHKARLADRAATLPAAIKDGGMA